MAGIREDELRFAEALTCGTAAALCAAVGRRAAAANGRLWINLEEVKAVDVAGLAALLQAVRRAEARGATVAVLPSPVVYRALLGAGILDELPLEGAGAGPALSAPSVDLEGASAPAAIAATPRLSLKPVGWEELRAFERWAHEPMLDQMVGSRLLYLCRHLGPYHPDFVAAVTADPTGLTLLIEPRRVGAEPVGFVRLFNVHLAEGFAFLETAVADPRWLRAGWGVEASRLLLAWAMDALEIRRVEAKVYAYNVLSINALRRNGFRQEGVLREARVWDGQRWDILVFAILEPEMREQRAREAYPDLGFWARDAGP